MSRIATPPMQYPHIAEAPAMLRNAGHGAAPVLTAVRANGRLRTLMLEMSIEQHYRNSSAQNIEAVYTFPLAHGAVLLDLEVELDGRTLSGQVIGKERAEREYEEAVEQGNSAILLEKSGTGLYTVNLGNLMAGESAVIRYRYAQTLSFAQGNLRLVLPTTIAPRYGDAEKQAGMRHGAVPSSNALVSYPFSLVLDVEAPFATCRVHSPSHAIRTHMAGTGVLRVELDQQGCLDRDFVLNIDGIAMQSALVLGRDGENTVAMTSLCPPLPAGREGARAPLTLKILVDCSGSMGGDSIAAAKRALHRILATLHPGDRVTYSRFGSRTIHDTPTPLLLDENGQALRKLSQFVSETDAILGGTELRSALTGVFALGDREAANVLLITDGETWDIDAIIQSAKTAGQRCFVVGIGSAPAANLLHTLAQTTQGACEFVAPREDVQGCVLRMFGRMRAPRIRDVRVQWPEQPLLAGDVPRTLFENETLHLFASFAQMPAGEIVLSWHSDDRREPHTLRMPFAGITHTDDTLARLFAAQRLAELDLRGEFEEAEEIAVRYALVSDHTHFLVVHERADADKAIDLPAIHKVDSMLAAGWGAVGTAMMAPPSMAATASLMVRAAPDFMQYQRDAMSQRPLASREAYDGGMASRRVDAMPDDEDAEEFINTDPPMVLLNEFATMASVGIGFPATITELASRIPDEWRLQLQEIATQRDEPYAMALFYRALLELCRRIGFDRTLQRHLLRLSRGTTAENVLREDLCIPGENNWH